MSKCITCEEGDSHICETCVEKMRKSTLLPFKSCDLCKKGNAICLCIECEKIFCGNCVIIESENILCCGCASFPRCKICNDPIKTPNKCGSCENVICYACSYKCTQCGLCCIKCRSFGCCSLCYKRTCNNCLGHYYKSYINGCKGCGGNYDEYKDKCLNGNIIESLDVKIKQQWHYDIFSDNIFQKHRDELRKLYEENMKLRGKNN